MLKPYKRLHGHYFKVVENKKSTSDKIITLCKVIETDDKINADYFIMKKIHSLRRCPICNSPDCVQKYVPRFFFIILLEGDKNKFLYHEFYGSECKYYFGFFLEMVNGYVYTRRRMKN